MIYGKDMQKHSHHHKLGKILFGGVYWLPPMCCLVSNAVISQSSPQGGPGESIAARYQIPRHGSPEGNPSHSHC